MTTRRICPITYEPVYGDEKYSAMGLKKLSPLLTELRDLPYTEEQQILEARNRATKMSVQGVQPKLSAKLDIKTKSFVICDCGGNYILKPQNPAYEQLPENEDLTMHLAASIMDVPLHGLVYCIDGKLTYFIKRFDRLSGNKKTPVEDFAQLSGLYRDTKYDFSMEKIVSIIDECCTFPALEKHKLFKRVLFNYLVGNEDMHLKNYSLITQGEIVSLAPGYDLINTTIAIGINTVKDEIALPIHGKRNNLTKKDLIDYYGMERLGLNIETIEKILSEFTKVLPRWHTLIDNSFLSVENQRKYKQILHTRMERLLVV